VPKVRNCPELLNAQAVGNALYGLQGMSSEHQEVRDTLDEVLSKFPYCIDAFAAQNISQGLFGLLNKTLLKSHVGFIQTWFLRIDELSSSYDITPDDTLMLYQSLALMDNADMPLTKSLVAASLYDDYVRLKKLLYDSFLRVSKSSNPKPPNRAEDYYFSRAKCAFNAHETVVLSCNEFLFGFEADIVIRIYDDSSKKSVSKIINIEIDGPTHRYTFRKQCFCALRDEHLKRVHGVEITRWDLLSPTQQRKKDAEIESDFIALLKLV
jgi:hypothetical protein